MTNSVDRIVGATADCEREATLGLSNKELRTLVKLLANELAPRVHNSGHWTIEGSETSQFENHLRAVADLPLGPTEVRQPHAAMVNVLGGARDDLLEAQAEVLVTEPGARVQLYGKSVVPGRKVGHVTVVGDDADDVRNRAQAAADHLMGVQR